MRYVPPPSAPSSLLRDMAYREDHHALPLLMQLSMDAGRFVAWATMEIGVLLVVRVSPLVGGVLHYALLVPFLASWTRIDIYARAAYRLTELMLRA